MFVVFKLPDSSSTYFPCDVTVGCDVSCITAFVSEMFQRVCTRRHSDVETRCKSDSLEDVLGGNVLYADECLVLNEYKYINIMNYRY